MWAHDETRKSFGIAGPRVVEDLKLSLRTTVFDGKHPRENAEVAATLRDIVGKLAAELLVEPQLAEYWQLYNDKNEPTTAGILKWAKRPADNFHFRTHTWEISCDSIEMRLIVGKGRSRKAAIQNEKRRLKIA